MDEMRRADLPWSVEHYGFEPHVPASLPVPLRGRHRRSRRTVWPRVAGGVEVAADVAAQPLAHGPGRHRDRRLARPDRAEHVTGRLVLLGLCGAGALVGSWPLLLPLSAHRPLHVV